MSTLLRHLQGSADRKHQHRLTTAIFGILATYGQNPKLLSNGKVRAMIPKELLQRPPDAVQAEVAGTQLTVEVTRKRMGEQLAPDALHFATYDFEHFRDWFANLIQKGGEIL